MEHLELQLEKNTKYFCKELDLPEMGGMTGAKEPPWILVTTDGYPGFDGGKVNYMTDTKSECLGRGFRIDAHLSKEELVTRMRRVIKEHRLRRNKNGA